MPANPSVNGLELYKRVKFLNDKLLWQTFSFWTQASNFYLNSKNVKWLCQNEGK